MPSTPIPSQNNPIYTFPFSNISPALPSHVWQFLWPAHGEFKFMGKSFIDAKYFFFAYHKHKYAITNLFCAKMKFILNC
jgi:hypothetical protein